jgi:DNA-binding transcriptional regulator YdaS (Cro superfamily)
MHHLYVCLFSNGHIKVGRSIDPVSRIAHHEARVSCVGIELVKHHITSGVGLDVNAAVPAEAALIEKCSAEAFKRNKNEWFEGLDFTAVCAWADEAAAVVYEPAAGAKACKFTPEDRRRLAELAGINPASLYQALTQRGTPFSPEKCVAIEAATANELRRKDLRPGDWHRIWPELVGKKGAPTPEKASV